MPLWKLALVGSVCGAVAGFAVWRYGSAKLDEQLAAGGSSLIRDIRPELSSMLRTELGRQVPPMVRTELRSTLASYGITPTTGRRIDSLLAAADRVGII
jgi:predicted component of type VI protein secretion system